MKPLSSEPLPASVALYRGPEHPMYGSAPNPLVSAPWSADSEYAVALLGRMSLAESQPHWNGGIALD